MYEIIYLLFCYEQHRLRVFPTKFILLLIRIIGNSFCLNIPCRFNQNYY